MKGPDRASVLERPRYTGGRTAEEDRETHRKLRRRVFTAVSLLVAACGV
jgi:hypothetical protein